MFAVGLTGGIGSGKSTAARLFAELGVRVIDTDAIAHALTATGQPALDTIAAMLGRSYLQPDGSLDRAALRERVFADPAARRTLENILHPLIRSEVAARLAAPVTAADPAPYSLVVVPLLFESGTYAGQLQRTLVVDCPEVVQISRAMARSALTEHQVRAIMAAQLDRAARVARADDVIVNDADLENLSRQVDHMHKKYIRLA